MNVYREIYLSVQKTPESAFFKGNFSLAIPLASAFLSTLHTHALASSLTRP